MKVLDRNLSWIDFNSRVLAMSEDSRVPLLERVRFLAIFANNFDEFFMVRIAKKQAQLSHSKEGNEYFAHINKRVQALYDRANTIYAKIKLLLTKEGVFLLDKRDSLNQTDLQRCEEIYDTLIEPIITPILLDKSYPFPYISHLDTHIVVTISEESADLKGKKHRYLIIKVPENISTYHILSGNGSYRCLSTTNIILFNLNKIFPILNILHVTLFRATRDMENTLNDNTYTVGQNILEHLELRLIERKRGDAIRIQIMEGAKNKIKELIKREMKIDDDMLFYSKNNIIDFGCLNKLYSTVKLPDLKHRRFTPSNLYFTKSLEGYDSIFDLIDQKDIIVQHPYDSFSSSTLQFLRASIEDKDVVAIKQTIYRTDSNAVLIDLLAEAASIGKNVLVVVEVHARFDENANLKWAKQLEHAGCHVIYGMQNLKVHCKGILVIKKNGEKLTRYAQISTGNYNADTAKVYEDIGLFTSNPDVAGELDKLFKVVSSGGYIDTPIFKHLMVSPFNMRKEFVKKINRMISIAKNGKQPVAYMKLNSLTDDEIIETIYRAAEEGVVFNIVVRGTCSMESAKNIRVVSVLGRFLEHSRVYIFDYMDNLECYIGSADLMYRNLNKRIEILAPIYESAIKNRLLSLLKKMASSDCNSWSFSGKRWHYMKGAYNIQDFLLNRRGTYQ